MCMYIMRCARLARIHLFQSLVVCMPSQYRQKSDRVKCEARSTDTIRLLAAAMNGQGPSIEWMLARAMNPICISIEAWCGNEIRTGTWELLRDMRDKHVWIAKDLHEGPEEISLLYDCHIEQVVKMVGL